MHTNGGNLSSVVPTGNVAVKGAINPHIEDFFLKGKVYGFPETDGELLSNYLAWVRNNHPFLSIFLADDNHPFTRKRRALVFYCQFTFALLMAGAVKTAFPDPDPVVIGIVSIIVACITVPYNTVLVMFAKCGRCNARFEVKYPLCSKFLFTLGYILLLIFSVFTIAYIIGGIILFVIAGGQAAASWIIGILESWVNWFIIWTPLGFFWNYKKHRNSFQEKYPGLQNISQANPTSEL